MAHISLTINGKSVSVDVESNTLLSDLLRDTLGMTGTHIGCDTSQCGCCLVLMNGDSVKSCTQLAVQADGADITTIEGLSSPDNPHPVQAAFKEAHGLQCGFCTPGMVISVVDLLQKNPKPSEKEIRDWLEGNMCRCTGYHNIVKAAQIAAENMNS